MPKISALTEITNPEPDDILAGVEESAATTKYIKLSTLLKMIYPVGSIYTNATDDTSPATLFGFGTWVAFGAGRVPVGQDVGDPDFATAQQTGGDKNHWHWQTIGSDGGIIYMRSYGSGAGEISKIEDTPDRTTVIPGNRASGLGRYDATEDASSLAPYVVVHMWKRTA